jgi:elongation factor Ts
MNIRRIETLKISNGVIISYVHNSIKEGLGKLGVLVSIKTDLRSDKILTLGKQIAMHIAATSPQSLNIGDLDNEMVEREKQVLIDQALASGKPKDIAEKMVVGRMQKFYQEVVLNEQTFVIDGETKIKDVIIKLGKELNSNIELISFRRLTLGEGIEVTDTDFATEVAATAGL